MNVAAATDDRSVTHVACGGEGCGECVNGLAPDIRGPLNQRRAESPVVKRKHAHGPNITVSFKRDLRPRTFVHARLAIDQAKADILALRNGDAVWRSTPTILASLDIQLNEIRRYLDGE